ncbi:hypothetical protein C2S52_022335 [Perilla frutescens var. hirtella]|nr:hypothetical protein C2S52_022335 [Perilla frutescens var. hirtella]
MVNVGLHRLHLFLHFGAVVNGVAAGLPVGDVGREHENGDGDDGEPQNDDAFGEISLISVIWVLVIDEEVYIEDEDDNVDDYGHDHSDLGEFDLFGTPQSSMTAANPSTFPSMISTKFSPVAAVSVIFGRAAVIDNLEGIDSFPALLQVRCCYLIALFVFEECLKEVRRRIAGGGSSERERLHARWQQRLRLEDYPDDNRKRGVDC